MASSEFETNAVERLVAESDIRYLIAAYVHNLDAGKVAENSELLAHARFEVVADVVEGREEIAKFFKRNVQHHEDGTPRTWHSVSNALIDVQSSTLASAVSYFTVHQELPGLPLQPIVTGRYADTFELVDGKWRFKSRAVQPRLFGELSFHVAKPATAATN